MSNSSFQVLTRYAILPELDKGIKMATVKVTIFFEKKFWVGTFERTDKEGYAIARHIFGGEPSDPQDS